MPFAIPRGGGLGGFKTDTELILGRRHPIYAERETAIKTNILAYHGGRPYIEERLTRFPAESAIAWAGNEAVRQNRFSNAVPAVGRKQRAYLVNNAYRICQKIRQFVFQRQPERDGADPAFVADANRTGQGLNSIMGELCDYITTCSWGWLGVDAPRVIDDDGNVMRPTLAEQRARKLRLYWNSYSAAQVPDWCIDETGEIRWLITESTYTENSDPRKEATNLLLRRLWEPGQVTEYRYAVNHASGEAEGVSVFGPVPIGYAGVPFVLAGQPSPLPWWFDDVEAINRAIMDLESANDEAYFRSVYPQLVIPTSVIESLQSQTESAELLARKVEMIIGYDSAIAERAEDKGITRWLMPPEGALGVIQKELERKREILFDTVGLQLKVQSRQVESAEAKAWGNLDAQAVLAERAQMLQEAETKAVAISEEWDSGFASYAPSYARTFDIQDINEELKTLVGLAPVDMPDGMRRMHLKAIATGIAKLANRQMSKDEETAVFAEIDGMDFMEPVMPPARPAAEDEENDEDEDEMVDEESRE